MSTTISRKAAVDRGRARPRPGSLVLAATLTISASAAVAVDADRLEAEARRIHQKVLVIDGHVDIPLDYGSGRRESGVDGDTQFDLPKLERGGVDAAVFAVYTK